METFDDVSQYLSEDAVDSSIQSDQNIWSLFADWMENEPGSNTLTSTSLLPDYREENGSSRREGDTNGTFDPLSGIYNDTTFSEILGAEPEGPDGVTPTVPSNSVSPLPPSEYSPVQVEPQKQMQEPKKSSQQMMFNPKFQTNYIPPSPLPMNASGGYPPHQIQPVHGQQQGHASSSGMRYPPDFYRGSQSPMMQSVPRVWESPKEMSGYTPGRQFFMEQPHIRSSHPIPQQGGQDYHTSSSQQQPMSHQFIHNTFSAPHYREPLNYRYAYPSSQQRNGSSYTGNYDSYYGQMVPPPQRQRVAAPPLKGITKKPSIINSKGKRKTDHELREEFYRREFRIQTGGKDPPRFAPSRSAYDESFKWRPQVNSEFGINIPIYRRLNGKLDSESTCRRTAHRVRTKSEEKSPLPDSDSITKDSCKGDIAYYFKKSRYAFLDEVTHEELDTVVEEFERGDVVAILNDGTVTRNTCEEDLKFVSIIPGSISDNLSPWKTLPDPAPEPIEDYQLVSLLGMVYVRVKDSSVLKQSNSSKIREKYVIVPSGLNDGFGKLVRKEEAKGYQEVVAIPFDNNVFPHNDGYLVLCLRSGATVQPLLESLREKNNSLASLQEEQQKELENLSSQVVQLGLDFKEHLKVHDSNDGSAEREEELKKSSDSQNGTEIEEQEAVATATQFDRFAHQLAGEEESQKNEVDIPKNIQRIEVYPRVSTYNGDGDTCYVLPLLLQGDGKDTLLHDPGCMVLFEPYCTSSKVHRRRSFYSGQVLENILLLDVHASNSEMQTYAVQKRSALEKSDIQKIIDGDYTHVLKNVFHEIRVEDRFVLRIFRVVRPGHSAYFLPLLFRGQIYREQFPHVSLELPQTYPSEWMSERTPTPTEVTSLHQITKNGQWDDLCLYVTSRHYTPAIFKELSEKELLNVRDGIDSVLQIRYRQELRNIEGVQPLIKDYFFPRIEGEPTIQQIHHLASHYVALLPARADSFTLPRVFSIMLAVRNNPVLSLKWATANNFTFLAKMLGWDKESDQVHFPHTDIARITLQFSAQLLEFSCVVRSLGVHCQVFIRTITRLLGEFKEDAATLDLLYSILLSFAKDPFIRNHLLKQPEVLEIMDKEIPSPSDSIQVKIQLIQYLMRQTFFTDVRTDDDVFATAPFLCKVPVPTSSGRDTMCDTFLFMYFRKLPLYSEHYQVAFWVRLPLSVELETILPNDGQQSIQLDFLTDQESAEDSASSWKALLVYNGKVMATEAPTRSEDDNLWHCTFSLDSPQQSLPTLLDRQVPQKGLYVVMEGTQLELNTWIALGGVRFF